jgi:hypothetical protein
VNTPRQPEIRIRSGAGGKKKQGFLAGAWGHIEYLNILIFKSFD